MPNSYGTFRTHVGFATEITYGTTVAAVTWIPANSYDDFTDDQGYVMDIGGRAKASKVYAIYPGVQQGKGAYTFNYYTNECARFWARLLGTDTLGSSSGGAGGGTVTGWQRTFTLADLPLSDTVQDFFGSTLGDRSFAGAVYESLNFKFDRKTGLATIKPTFLSAAPTTGPGTEATPSYGTDAALRGYEAVFSVGGSTKTTLLTFDLTLTRQVELIFAGNNSQKPSGFETGNFDCVGKIEFYGSTDQPYTDYRAGTQQAIELVMTDTTVGSSYARLDILATKAQFTKVVPDRSGPYLRYAADFQAIHNATDAGPLQVITTISTSSAVI